MTALRVTWTEYMGTVDLFADPEKHTEEEKSGWLTTDHAASSYGMPVLVDDAGCLYDPSSRLLYAAAAENDTETMMDMIPAALQAGHRVYA